MYLLPQEIEVWYIIPMIRKTLAKHLVEDHRLSYEKTGKILGVTKAAISQYQNNKRANKIKLSKEMEEEIKKSAKILSENNNLALIEMEKILTLMKKTKCSCNVCKKYNKDVLNYCNCKPEY